MIEVESDNTHAGRGFLLRGGSPRRQKRTESKKLAFAGILEDGPSRPVCYNQVDGSVVVVIGCDRVGGCWARDGYLTGHIGEGAITIVSPHNACASRGKAFRRSHSARTVEIQVPVMVIVEER